MFSLIRSLYEECSGNSEYNLCILGINQTGKTVLFNTIKHINEKASTYSIDEQSSIIIYKPTIGLNVLKYKNGNDRFTIWDLGGKPNIRKIWQNYYSECHGVIYMVNHNIEEAIQILKTILAHQQMAKIPISVITINENQKEHIEKLLTELQCLKDRRYSVYALSIQKMHYMKPKIKDVLHSIYINIKKLHQQIKQ